MTDRIKGITVLIEGDTVGLEKALKGVNQTSRKLQSELKDVQRLLKFDPNNAALLAQKQKLLTDEIENTSKKLDTLKETEKQVQKQFEKGEIKEEQYRAFQRELAQTENSLRAAKSAMQNMQDEQENVQKGTRQLTRLFEITGKSVEDYADVLGTRLVRAIQNGTATSRDLQNAFQKVGTAATGSKDNIRTLTEEIEKIDAGTKDIAKVRKEIQKLGQDAKDAEGKVDNLGGVVGGIAAGAAGAAGAGIGVQAALDADTLDTIIDVSFNVDEKGKAAIKDAYYAITAYGVEGEAALEGVRRAWVLNGDATDAENKKIVQSAGVITKAYSEIDFTQLIQESSEFGEALGIGQQGALEMTNALLKMGFPPDELDILAEYGSQLKRAGYDATQIQGIFAAGVSTKSWNIDVLLDGLKEGRIRIAEFGTGVDDATLKLIEGTGLSATKLQEWGDAIAGGGEKGQQAMGEVSTALATIEDDTVRNAIGTRLFGTLWEEQGEKITTTLDGANDKTVKLTDNTKLMNDAIATVDTSAQVELNNALIGMNNALMPLYTTVANYVTQLALWVQANPQIAAGIAIITGALALVSGAIAILTPIVTFLINVFKTLLPVFRWIGTIARIVAVAIGGLSAPVWIAIGVIAALIAIGVLLYKNWDKISEKVMELSRKAGEAFNKMYNKVAIEMSKIKTKVEVAWNNIKAYLKNTDLSEIGKDVIRGFISGISAMSNPLKTAVRALAKEVPSGLKSFLKMGSPSKLTEKLGKFTGEGFAIGMQNSMSQISDLSRKMASSAVPDVKTPKTGAIASGNASKSLTVNLNSPKALDVREANKQFNRTLNKMSLMW